MSVTVHRLFCCQKPNERRKTIWRKRKRDHRPGYSFPAPKALDETVKAGDALTASLSDEQKEFFEDYMTAQREVNILTDCETFCYGFKVGAKIMLDILTEGQMREI